MDTPQAFAVLGPTAGGKTALALRLAQTLPVEIISLDSALVYRHMDIGTAKPTPSERAAVPHHLIDIISPLESYSAAEFVADCVRLAGEIRARGRLPLIVGGTMMYFHALTQGLNDLPEADAATRAALAAEKEAHGLAYLYRRLEAVDPATAGRLKPNDSQRIERALEIYLLTGKPMSAHLAEQTPFAAPLDLCTLALVPDDRAALHKQIACRFHQMVEQGFLNEVSALQSRYPALTPDMNSMRCVGYRQAWEHLQGLTDCDTFIEKGIAATRQLAKRQLTWLRKMQTAHTLDPYTDRRAVQTASELVRRHFGL